MTRPRIVLADDHPDVAEPLRDLRWAEYEMVAIVPDGRELVEAVHRLEPDVIVADILMPPVTRGLRSEGRHERFR